MLFRYVFLFSFFICACQSGRQAPNVVIILADDLGYGDIERYNPTSEIPTTNLNRLADEGMRFTDAHSPSSVCTPTRYGLLTGRYAWRTDRKRGVFDGYAPLLIDTSRLTLPKMFKNHGYVTGATGKWHLGFGNRDSTRFDLPLVPGPNAIGFDYFWGIVASPSRSPYVYIENTGVEAFPSDSIASSAHRRRGGGGFWRPGLIAPGYDHEDVLPIMVDKSVAFIEEHASNGPFFLYVALTAPHTPWLPLKEYRGKSDAGYYGDFVVQMDDAVGEILRAIDDVERETLLFFTSDNGASWPEADRVSFGHDANGPWRGQKADIWEGGHRVPFIVRWPGRVEPNSTSDHLVSLTDFMATSATLLGAHLPEVAGQDSYDFYSTFTSATPGTREAMVQHSLHGMFAMRQGRWKLITERGSGGFTHPRSLEAEPGEPAGQLYDLYSDPAESLNLYLEAPAIVDSLTVLLEYYRAAGRSHP